VRLYVIRLENLISLTPNTTHPIKVIRHKSPSLVLVFDLGESTSFCESSAGTPHGSTNDGVGSFPRRTVVIDVLFNVICAGDYQGFLSLSPSFNHQWTPAPFLRVVFPTFEVVVFQYFPPELSLPFSFLILQSPRVQMNTYPLLFTLTAAFESVSWPCLSGNPPRCPTFLLFVLRRHAGKGEAPRRRYLFSAG